MMIDTENLISMTEANQNFSQVVKKVDEDGTVVILKNNKPKYIVKRIGDEGLVFGENEAIELIALRILHEHRRAFEELAK